MTAKFNGSGNRLFSVNYNARRMVTSMTVGNQPGYTTSFSYDANGYRIKKSNSSGAKIYLLEGEHIESVYDRDYNLQANYLRGAVVDEIINGFERNDDTGKMENRTFHHDQVNSVVAVSDHNGKAVQEHSYGPFGETFDSSGTSQNTMKYTGREQDDETGLYYYRARYYDPELGRFISEDPIGFKGGINFYAYVGNNPLIGNDPSGLVVKYVTDTLGGGIEMLLSSLRRKGVNRAWKQEQDMVNLQGYGTKDWTPAQMDELLSNGKVSGFDGHHINSVQDNPLLAGCPDNICFMTRDEHFSAHDFNWQNPTSGPLLDRTGGGFQLFDGGSWGAAAIVGLEYTGEVLDFIGELDPFERALYIPSVGGCIDGICSDTIYDNTFTEGASGGFLLYPNKLNLNSVRSVYSK